MKRRSFIKWGLLSPLPFLFSSCEYSNKEKYLFLTINEYNLLKKIIPSFLGHSVKSIEELISKIDHTIFYLHELDQADLHLAFSLLSNPISRFILFSDYRNLNDNLCSSQLLFKTQLHQALVSLINGTYYTTSEAWGLISYPGPLEL